MFRPLVAILLVAAGLAVGLWLGINPTTRAQVERDWAKVSSSAAGIKTGLDVKIGNAETSDSASKNSPETPTWTAPLKAVPNALEAFWGAARQLWFSLVARLDISP